VLALACVLYPTDLTVLHIAVPSLSADLVGGLVAFLAVWGTLFPLQRHTLDPLRDTTPRFTTPPQAP
jgi:hypothetical protein